MIVSDGSSDETVDLARMSRNAGGVRVLALPKNRGKVAALNAGGARSSKARSSSSPMLPRCWRPIHSGRLVENFADPAVGAASGRYRVVKPNEVNIGASEDLYWKYEAFLKTQESRLASTLGAHGHLHAIRKELYPFPPPKQSTTIT